MINLSIRNGLLLARRHLRISVILFTINLLTAILLTIPMYRKLMSELDRNLMGAVLLKGFGYSWFFEFTFNNPSFLETMGAAILPVGLCYIFLWSILSGGILEVFSPDGEGGGARRFFSGLAKHFFPFLRLTILSSAIYLLTYWLLMIEAEEWLEDLIKDSPSHLLEFSVGIGITLLTIVVILFLDMIFDYARIKKVIDGFPSVTLSIIGSLRFCLKNLPGTIAVYSILLILSGVLITTYLMIYSIIPQNDLFWIISLFLLQEAFMFGRIFIRVATYSSQMEFYLRNNGSMRHCSRG